jgi:ADP-heptose:LPS heptosyltransferase
MQKQKPTKRPPHPKVAVYFCNGIGNLLMLSPALQALSQLYDNSKIDVVVPSEWNDYRKSIVLEILNEWGLVNKAILFPEQKFYPQRYKQLFITSHNESSQAFSLFKQKGNSFTPASWLSDSMHEVEYYMNEVRKLGFEGATPPVTVPLIKKQLKLKGKRPKIAIYNGAARLGKMHRWERKTWDKFDNLAEQLHNYYKVDIIYLGGNSEIEEGKRLAATYPFVFNYAGKLSFLESVKVLSQCKLLVSTDSALMHVAEAVNVPVVALFGATLASKNRPYSYDKYRIVRGKCRFAPCQYTNMFVTCNDYTCMTGMQVGDVMQATIKARGNIWEL